MSMREDFIQIKPIQEKLIKHTLGIKGMVVSVYSNKASIIESLLSNIMITSYSLSTDRKEDYSIVAIYDEKIMPKGLNDNTGFIPKQNEIYTPGVENHYYMSSDTVVTVLYYPAPSVLINSGIHHSVISGTVSALIYHSKMILKQIITKIYYSQGYYPLHASCICKDDKAYLFIGKTHSGKTTIMLNMAASGYTPMNDDIVFLLWDNDEIWVESMPTVPQIRQDSLEFLTPKTYDDADIGDIDIYGSFGFCKKAKVKAIMLSHTGFSETTVLPVDPQNCKTDLLKAFMAHLKIPVDANFARVFYSLLEHQFYDLQLGPDMMELKRWLDRESMLN